MADYGDFSYGSGLMAPPERGHIPTAYERLRATRLTDPSNPEASEDAVLTPNATHSSTDSLGVYVPGDLKPGVTPMVTETGPAPSTGQHKIINPLVPNEGHEADGEQNGAGRLWRASVPSNPVTGG